MPPRPTGWCGLRRDGQCWSSVPAGLRVRMQPSWEQERPTSADATAPPAPSQTSSTAFWQEAPWPIPGSRCLTRSMRLSRPTASSIPTMPHCWWIPTIPSSPVCPMPSGPSTRCSNPWALPSAASVWTPATWHTCPGKPGRCWMRRDGPSARFPYPMLWMST